MIYDLNSQFRQLLVDVDLASHHLFLSLALDMISSTALLLLCCTVSAISASAESMSKTFSNWTEVRFQKDHLVVRIHLYEAAQETPQYSKCLVLAATETPQRSPIPNLCQDHSLRGPSCA